MPTIRIGFLLSLCACGSLWTGPLTAQERRGRDTPGLILETGARMGACDVLTFTPDGRYLLAAGDDKVVRIWKFTEKGLEPDRILRWGTWREQRGSIYTLALSPDRDSARVAIAGAGVKTDAVAVLERATGRVLQALTKTPSESRDCTVWSLAFSPSGNHLTYGTHEGGVWLWDLTSRKANDTRLLGKHPSKGSRFNYVRLVAFLSEKQLLSIAENGEVLRWNLSSLAAPPTLLFRFEKLPNLRDVVISRDHKWLAGISKRPEKGKTAAIELRSLDGRQSKEIRTTGQNLGRHTAIPCAA
jgi:WD40 repeat protein